MIFLALDVFSIIFPTAYVEVKNQLSQGPRIVCYGYVYVLPEVRNLSNNGQKQSDITSFETAISTLFSAVKSIHCFDRKAHSIPIKCNDINI